MSQHLRVNRGTQPNCLGGPRQNFTKAGRVEEVANAVLLLALDEASYMTRAKLWADGGYLAT